MEVVDEGRVERQRLVAEGFDKLGPLGLGWWGLTVAAAALTSAAAGGTITDWVAAGFKDTE